ncbi:MAG: hypothetical protein JRF57_05010 [Deltaproteobacteria bacterium]|nr:hypothetical protein [Deltaproteobacteria bacterium]MBW2303054.1 hypothetical protein [Deltaproteobacteria bacterium]
MVEWKPEWMPERRYHAFVLNEDDLKAYPCWYLDAAHSIPPWTPLFIWSWTHHQRYGDLWAAETMGLPTCRGTDWREVDGCAYMCPVLVTDEAEKRARSERFKQHLQSFVTGYNEIHDKVILELNRSYDRFKAFNPDQAGLSELYDHFEQVFHFNYRVWGLHSWMLYTLFAFYSLFEDLCREYAGINDTSPLWHRLIRGFDNKMLEVNRTLWKLAMDAAEQGLDPLIKGTPDREVLNALEENEAGRRWLHRENGFYDFVRTHGWRMPRVMEFNAPSIIERPEQLFPLIRHCFERPQGMEDEASRAEIVRDRLDAEAEIISKFPPSERSWVRKLMELTQQTGIFAEGHNYYFEHTSHALMRRAALACAKRLVREGLMDDPEDFVFLLPDDFRRNLLSLRINFRPLIEERKAYYRKYSLRTERPHLIGRLSDDPQKAMEYVLAARDYVMLKLTVGSRTLISRDLKADLVGNPAAPGLGQGRACLVLDENDIAKIKDGDILVAVTTYSSWTPFFPLIRGIVLDSGASLSHAAIMGREHDIPVVVQTGEATKKLKDGQHIRIDGERGAVWILEDGP